jgi:hypothetical protein
MTHQEAVKKDAMGRYALNIMTREEVIEFEEHALVCEICHKRIEMSEVFTQSLRTLATISMGPEVDQPEKTKRKWWQFWL